MNRRKIGKTNLTVPVYGCGTAPLGGLFAPVSAEAARGTLQTGWDAGLTFIDTAPWYGFGLAERYVGDFLRDKPNDSFVLSTKVGRLCHPAKAKIDSAFGFVNPLPFDVTYDYSYDGIMRSVEFSYARLGLNKIDILFVHDIGVYTHGAAQNAVYMRQLFEGGLRALDELKSAGTISAYGLGVNEVPVCLDVLKRADLDVILLAGRYSLLDRSAEAELLGLCQSKSTSIVVGGAFNSGILATGAKPGAYFDYAPATEEVLTKVSAIEAGIAPYGIPLPAAAMQFPLKNPVVASVLVGASAPEFLKRNVELLKIDIPTAVFEAANGHTLVAPPLGENAVRQ